MRSRSLFANFDWITGLIYLVLILLGWINIYAAVYDQQHSSIFDITQRYGKQMLWIGAALVIALFVMLIEEKFFEYFAYPIYGIGVFLLLAVLIFGKEINGARSWFSIAGFQLQPSEFSKFATALAISSYLTKNGFSFHKKNDLIRIVALPLFPMLLIMVQPDFGSALVFLSFILVFYRFGLSPVIPMIGIITAVLFIVSLLTPFFTIVSVIFLLAALIMALYHRKVSYFFFLVLSASFLFVIHKYVLAQAGIQFYGIKKAVFIIGLPTIIFLLIGLVKRIKYTFLAGLIFVFISGFSLSVDYVFEKFLEPHQQKRINVLLGLEEDPMGAGYNVKQSKIAIGSGGFAGKGFLNGTQTKYRFVPEQSTDFIFCTVGEEWGFVGTSTVIILFVLLLIRIINLAERQRSMFSKSYGYCIAGIFFFHLMINISMTIGLFPVIGIPLPFFSYGGSSLWAFTVMLFVFLRMDSTRMNTLVR